MSGVEPLPSRGAELEAVGGSAFALRRGEVGRLAPGRELRVSVIIPTLDEEARIATRLRELGTLSAVTEVIVVDGGSGDATVAIARSFPTIRVLEGVRGRAAQMNRGAAAARGDVLLFLHADVSLPVEAGALARRPLDRYTFKGCGGASPLDKIGSGTSRQKNQPVWGRVVPILKTVFSPMAALLR